MYAGTPCKNISGMLCNIGDNDGNTYIINVTNKGLISRYTNLPYVNE